jgi:hypothetical protein
MPGRKKDGEKRRGPPGVRRFSFCFPVAAIPALVLDFWRVNSTLFLRFQKCLLRGAADCNLPLRNAVLAARNLAATAAWINRIAARKVREAPPVLTR